MLPVSRYTLTKPRMLHLLEELKSDSIKMGSLCVKPRTDKKEIEAMMGTIVDIKTVPEDLFTTVNESETGAIIFWGPHHRYLVIPPFPTTKQYVSNTCEIEPLNTLLHTEFLFGLVLVRLGEYGVGVVRGETLVTAKVGTGLVHARHRQGGSSSHRFERHREKQMETFFTRVCMHAREQLEPYDRRLEFILYGGTRETITDFRKQCHFLSQFDKRSLKRLLNVREPKQAGMGEAIQEAWSSKVIQWD
jgi:peptide subunit release factor 1 (eRF1)